MSDEAERPPPPYEPGERETIEGPGGTATESGTSKGLVIGVGIAALVLLAGGVGVLLTMQRGNDPAGVVGRFFKAIDSGQCEKAVDLLVLEGVRREDTLAECESSQEELEILVFEVTRVEQDPVLTTPDGADQVAVVHYRIDAEGGREPIESTLRVARFDGDWRILLAQADSD